MKYKTLVAIGTLVLSGGASADSIDDFVRREMQLQSIPGASIAVIRNGQITKAKGYGFADLDHNVPATADTVYAYASITKQFTASLIMLLVDEGKISLDDRINLHLKDSNPAWSDITIRHLLNHTAGLAPLRQGFASLTEPSLTRSTASLFEAAKKDPINGLPGEKWSYSDVGYFLLGMIIESVTGATFSDFLSKRILQPLSMTTARIRDLNLPYKNLAKGYTAKYTEGGLEIHNIRRDRQLQLTSHFGLFGTVKDLARWDAALYTDFPIKQSLLAQMWQPTRLNGGTVFPYGYGWGLSTRNGYPCMSHTGITGTAIFRAPDLKTSVVVLTNLGSQGTQTSRGARAEYLAKGILTIAERRFRLKPIAEPDPKVLQTARLAMVQLSKGQIAGDPFTQEARDVLSRDLKTTTEDLSRLGQLENVAVLEQDLESPEPSALLLFTFEKGERMYRAHFDSDRNILDLYPDA